MSTSSRFWADWTTLEIAQAQPVVVLPVAATEQHGPHLPLGVDTMLLNGVIAAALPHITSPALFLPTMPVGFSPEHAAFPGTLTLRAGTLIRLWTDIAESVHASGVRKLLIFNSHGGQVGLLDVVARDLRARLGMTVFSASWFGLGRRSSAPTSTALVFTPVTSRPP